MSIRLIYSSICFFFSNMTPVQNIKSKLHEFCADNSSFSWIYMRNADSIKIGDRVTSALVLSVLLGLISYQITQTFTLLHRWKRYQACMDTVSSVATEKNFIILLDSVVISLKVLYCTVAASQHVSPKPGIDCCHTCADCGSRCKESGKSEAVCRDTWHSFSSWLIWKSCSGPRCRLVHFNSCLLNIRQVGGWCDVMWNS